MKYQWVIAREYAYTFGLLLIGSAQRYVSRNVRVSLETGCWVWQLGSDGKYGRAKFMGQEFKAHRLSFLAFNGPIPGRGRVLDHDPCNRGDCCSPHHLAPVSQKQNMRRCWATGRGYSPFVHKDIL